MSSPSRAQRLRLPREFARTLSKGRRFRGEHFSFIVVRDAGQPARIGLAISRKAAPRAVRRNRIKRMVRESFRVAAPLAGWIVVMARPGAGKLPDAALQEDLIRQWTRLREACPDCFSASSAAISG